MYKNEAHIVNTKLHNITSAGIEYSEITMFLRLSGSLR